MVAVLASDKDRLDVLVREQFVSRRVIAGAKTLKPSLAPPPIRVGYRHDLDPVSDALK